MAQAAGVQVRLVNPKHTSQMCAGTFEPGLCVNEPIVSAYLPLRRLGEPGTSRLL